MSETINNIDEKITEIDNIEKVFRTNKKIIKKLNFETINLFAQHLSTENIELAKALYNELAIWVK